MPEPIFNEEPLIGKNGPSGTLPRRPTRTALPAIKPRSRELGTVRVGLSLVPENLRSEIAWPDVDEHSIFGILLCSPIGPFTPLLLTAILSWFRSLQLSPTIWLGAIVGVFI